MFDISDSELVMLYRENNEEAALILNQKYTIIIKKIINRYYPPLKKLNINMDELMLNCHELLNNALETYNSLSKASFQTYLNLIIDRNIKKVIIKELRKLKNNPEDSFTSFDDISSNDLNTSIDPLNVLCTKENEQDINKLIIEKLNNKELAIFSLLLDGLSYKDIACTLMQSYKQIYKKVQNIRKKLAPELQKMFY